VQQTTQTCLNVQQVIELTQLQQPQFMSMYKREKDADNKLTFVQSRQNYQKSGHIQNR